MTREECWFWLCSAEEIWQQDIAKLFDIFDSPEELFETEEAQLYAAGCLNARQIRSLIESRKSMVFMQKLDKLKRNNIRFVYYGSPEFPERLNQIPDHPYALYVRGRLPDPSKISIGMVGARACSEYGRDMARHYASALAREGMQIISGMAVGIDSVSASAAMEAGGTTFAVLGSGIDVIYPLANTGLYYEIIMNNGGIISEYGPGVNAVGWHFPHRNRIIAGLSDKLLVLEARKKSGTLTTAAHALEQGVDIYALPGRADEPLSEGTNRLIYDGAGMLLDVRYLLDEIYGSRAGAREAANSVRQKSAKRMSGNCVRVNNHQKKKIPEKTGGDIAHVLSVLEKGIATAEQIGENSGIHEPQLSMLLCEMEIMGIIKQTGKDCYTL